MSTNKFRRGRAATNICSKSGIQQSLRLALLAFAPRMFWVVLAALPIGLSIVPAGASTGEHLAAGQATIQAIPRTAYSVAQPTGATILNWKSFSFVTNEAVRVIQPSVYSIALSHLIGVDQSVMLGQLPSDSQIFLINPHKKLSGATRQVNTGEFLATALQVRHDTSLEGFKAVVNGSTIHVSEHGYVALVAPGVSTEGVIVANVGTALAGSDKKYTLDLMSDGLINYAISDKALREVTGLNDTALTGTISSNRTGPAGVGQVILHANTADDVISAVVNTSGISRARHLINRDGVARLEDDSAGLMRVAESVDTSGMVTDHRGGHESSVLRESTSPPGSARTDTFKRVGASTAPISGNGHGQKLTPSVTSTPMATDQRLKATIPSNGESGKVTPGNPPLNARQDKSQNTNSLSPVPNHSKPKRMSPARQDKNTAPKSGNDQARKLTLSTTSTPLAIGSELKATVPPNGDSGKDHLRKSSPKVREDRSQSLASTSAVWRKPKWNFLADWDETTAPTSGTGQVRSPLASQPTR